MVCVLVAVCLLTMSFDPETLVPLGSTTLLEVTFSICELGVPSLGRGRVYAFVAYLTSFDR